ncbi:hypothetical protein AWH56_008830 [Anaerobacillus isosaccharinicus]|uniref:Uncharacterized protein n=1 Tax=Anaerobacillus isosaccharinicus TaxID=1532552 RepID=A0A1S2L2G9_9BACI|nr:hypothetical protein [Anaerobacillus isosaccharinicus]MBA5588923.1 hypothetical protein [Anaerobacillus isosaccharinicus]QOY37666.1 hypothetical protein AWH56_008830 [Anaerobacillus isosaccharinicus]
MEKLNAGQLMEIFFQNGHYADMKAAEKKADSYKKHIRRIMDSGTRKRLELPHQNIVLKYMKKSVSTIDQIGLNEYLVDVGIFPLVAEIDAKKAKGNELLDLYQLPREHTLGIAVNGNGKVDIDVPNVEGLKLKPLVDRYVHFNKINKEVSESYEKLKKQMISCPQLAEVKKMKHKYGSVYLKELPPKYDNQAIVDDLGLDFLINMGKPNGELLDKFILQGTITKGDIDQFKTVVDYRMDFIIMDLDSENNMMEFLQSKRMTAAQNFAR